jgi:transcriptional regulator with XRE-family HTH domain
MNFKTTLYQLIGSRIKTARISAKMNQEDLASSVGLARTSISNIELGRQQVTMSMLYEISQALETDIHALLPTYNEVNTSVVNSSDPIEILKTKDVTEGLKQQIEDFFKDIDSNKS